MTLAPTHPGTDMATSTQHRFAALRAREFSRLDTAGEVYLDYTGSGLYPESLVRRHAQRLIESVLGNPHSENPTSRASTHEIEHARAAVLDFFDADPAEYTVCFTTNATAAIKLVGESFPFAAGSRLVLPVDNHNSVNGIREFAARGGALVDYLPLDGELRLDDPTRRIPQAASRAPSLFAFPAQSNFSGVKHPLELVEMARGRGYSVLLDAAAFVATQSLSLRQVRPDFVTVSFYKMFGYPTGVGALIARHEALQRLVRPWFAGGTVDFVSTSSSAHLLRSGEAAFEDGTPNFLGIGAVPDGLALLGGVGLDHIGGHVARLADRLLDGLRSLRHSDGRPAVTLYGPDSTQRRGGTIAFNMTDRSGGFIAPEHVVAAAAARGISLRGGCFCNPGAAEAALGYHPDRLRRCIEAVRNGLPLTLLSHCLGDTPAGAVRASLGLASNDHDVDCLMTFLSECRDSGGLAPAALELTAG